MVPETALITREGLDFVGVAGEGGLRLRAVVIGEGHRIDGQAMVEVLTGLQPGDAVETDGALALAGAAQARVEGAAADE